MNQITLEQTRDALLKTQYVTEVPEDIRTKITVHFVRQIPEMLAIAIKS